MGNAEGEGRGPTGWRREGGKSEVGEGTTKGWVMGWGLTRVKESRNRLTEAVA